MDGRTLEETWADVTRNGDEVPLFFYSHLFLSYPRMREMFPPSMAGQRDKFLIALGRIVSDIDRLDDVRGYLRQLGRDHRRFKVTAEDYPAVHDSLLATVEYFLGPAAWTDKLAAQWSEAYERVARVMIDAAEEAAEDSPPWWDGTIQAVDRRGLDIAVLQVRTDRPYPYRPGQSAAIEFGRWPRLWRHFSPANAPRADGTLELHVKLIEGGAVSTALVQSAVPGDTLRIGAPVGGHLALPDSGDLLMVAGSTGLAPLRAVVQQLDERDPSGPARRVHLFHGVRYAADLYDDELLSELARSRPWFEYTPVVSDDLFYPGERGLVGDVVTDADRWRDRSCLVCGSPPMVRHTVTALTAAGVPAEQVHHDAFTPGPADGTW